MCGMIHHFIDLFSAIPCAADENPSSENNGSPPLPQLLLIVILDAIGKKAIVRNFISPTPELEAQFHRYAQIAGLQAAEDDFAAAFYSLQASGFWYLVDRPDKNEGIQGPRGSAHLRKRYLGAKFSDDLYPLLVMEPSRNRLRHILVEGYFSSHLHHGSALEW